MDRYSTLWRMPENMYSPDSPVIVRAGAILKDNETNSILIQLKIENISDLIIRSLKINFNLFDIEGNVIQSDINHQYFNVSAGYKDTFGQNSPAVVNNKEICSFEITGIVVMFDNTNWTNTEKYHTVSNPEDYIMQITKLEMFSKFIAETHYNLFWKKHSAEKEKISNTITELYSHTQSSPELAKIKINEYTAILNVPRKADSDFTETEKFLLSDIENTIQSLNNEKTAHKKEVKSKRIKVVFISLAIVFVSIAALIVGIFFMLINTGYNTAIASLNNGNYEGAIADFEVLGNYKDSEDKLLEAKFGLAKKMESISIAEAYSQYSNLPSNYPGVSERMTYLKKYIPYTEKYKMQSVVIKDGTGAILSSEEHFSNNDAIKINLCIKDGKLCYAPDALSKYNSIDSGTFTFEYAELKPSDNKDFEYYCEYDKGFGNDDFVYISKGKIFIINKDLSLISEEKSEITETLYVKE